MWRPKNWENENPYHHKPRPPDSADSPELDELDLHEARETGADAILTALKEHSIEAEIIYSPERCADVALGKDRFLFLSEPGMLGSIGKGKLVFIPDKEESDEH